MNFRISVHAQERLNQNAELFNLDPSAYAKAVLYRDLGVFGEPLDQRRRMWKRKKTAQSPRTIFDEEPEQGEGFVVGRRVRSSRE